MTDGQTVEFPARYLLTVRNEYLADSQSLFERLEPFAVYRFARLPGVAAVTVQSRAEQESLLETLAQLPQVMYRQALTRRSLTEGDRDYSA